MNTGVVADGYDDGVSRPTIDQVRERLLDAGVAVLQQHFENAKGASAISAIDLKAVAAEAGYSSPGMIYTAWTSPDSDVPARERYVHDLALRLIDLATTNGDADELVASIEPTSELAEAVREIANHTFTTALDDSTGTAYSALASLGRASALRAVFAERELDRIRSMAPIYEGAFAVAGRKLRPGLEAVHIALLLRSLERGLATGLDLVPELELHDEIRWEGTDGWTLFSVACWELLMGMSVPIDDTDA